MRSIPTALSVLAAFLIVLMLGLTGCGGEAPQSGTSEGASEAETVTETAGEPTEEAVSEEETMAEHDGPMATLQYIENGRRMTRDVPYLPDGRKVATIETEKGTIQIELWEEHAPNTVINFVSLANSGRYDGVEFHRIIDGFMAQTGDVEGKGGYGGPGYMIPAEFNAELKHERGVVSMARSTDPDSAGSQFFIMLAEAGHLDGQYAAFGKVISGMDVVDALKKGDKANNGKVDDPDVMTKVRVATVE